MVTGPMPRKPKATNPKANTAGASIWVRVHGADQVAKGHQEDHRQADVVSGKITRDEAGEYPERCAAFFADVTTSFTWRDSVEVKTFTNSG